MTLSLISLRCQKASYYQYRNRLGLTKAQKGKTKILTFYKKASLMGCLSRENNGSKNILPSS